MISKDKALLEKLESDLKSQGKDRDDLMSQYQTSSASRFELYGEKNTDREEKLLADAVSEEPSSSRN